MDTEDNQKPTFAANMPDCAVTDGEDACDLASAYFGEPMEWQRRIIRALLARLPNDKYACKAFALSIPRQNGKSWLVRARCLYGAVVLGEHILFTCQHGDTSDAMFKAFADIFEDEDNEVLNGLLKAVRRTNGQQAVFLRNGGLIRFTTRTNSLARGKSYDVLIYDEAQELTTAQQAASLPTISASKTHNSQRIYLGTPPTDETGGDVFGIMHDRVHAGESPTPWVEWAVDEIGDVSDRARWRRANPSFGALLDEAAIEGEASEMPPASFAVERLGWYKPAAAAVETVIPADEWAACEGAPRTPDGAVQSVGVRFAADGSVGSFARAWKDGDGTAVEVLDALPLYDCIDAAAAWCIANKDDIAEVHIDGKQGCAAFIARLADAGFPRRAVHETKTVEVVAANSMLLDAVASGGLVHFGQPPLDISATKSAKRRIGAEGVGFESTDEAEASLIEAVALALRAAITTKRNPHKKMRVL